MNSLLLGKPSRLVGITLMAIVAILSIARGDGDPLEEAVARKCKEATVFVDLGPGGSGSAFLVHSSGIFVTNRHVVAGVPGGELVKLVLHSGAEEEQILEARIALLSEGDDLALLKTDTPLRVAPLPLAAGAGPAELAPVVVLGYPFGKRLAADGNPHPSISINAGRVSGLRRHDEELDRIQYDATTNPGNSGGPMVNGDGEVIGVVVSTIARANVNFAIPAAKVRALLDEPVVAFYPTKIPFPQRGKELDFDFEVLPNVPVPDGAEITLHLGKPGATRRSATAKLEDGRCRIQAVPLVPTGKSAAFRLRLEAKLGGATITANVDDAPVRVGDQAVQLSQVRGMRLVNGSAQTILTKANPLQRRYETVEGRVTGIPPLHSEHHDLKLGLDRAQSLQVSAYDPGPMELSYEVVLKSPGQKEVSRLGRISLVDPPANLTGTLHPKGQGDMFSKMFASRNEPQGLNLLDLVDLKSDAKEGEWNLVNHRLKSSGAARTWCEIPVHATSYYGLRAGIVPSENERGELLLHLPVGEAAVLLRVDGGKAARATLENVGDHAAGEGVAVKPFRKEIPFEVVASVFQKEGRYHVTASFIVTEKQGNFTSSRSLPERLQWSGLVADLKEPKDCPVRDGLLGIGVAGQAITITKLNLRGRDGFLRVRRELPPLLSLNIPNISVRWSFDTPLDENRVPGSTGRDDFPFGGGGPGGGFPRGIGSDGYVIGNPKCAAVPALAGAGALRLGGKKAGFHYAAGAFRSTGKPRDASLSLWFKADKLPGPDHRHYLFDEGTKNAGVAIYLHNGALVAGGWNRKAKQPADRWEGTWLRAPGLTGGDWHHVALVLAAKAEDRESAFRLYVNGVQVGKGFGKGWTGQSPEALSVGTFRGQTRSGPDDPIDTRATNSQFTGLLDEVSAYRSALDQEAVTLLAGGRFGAAEARFPPAPVSSAARQGGNAPHIPGKAPEVDRVERGPKNDDDVIREVRMIGQHEGRGNHRWVTRAALTPDGKHLLTGSLGDICAWEMETGRRMKRFNVGTGTWALDVSPNGRAASGNDGTLRIHDWENGQLIGEFPAHAKQIWGTAFTADGERVVTVAKDGLLAVWDIRKKEKVKSIELGGPGRGLMLMDGGKSALVIVSGAAGNQTGSVELWDLETGKRVRSFNGHSATPTSVHLSSDGSRLVTGSADHTLQLWEFKSGKEIHTIKGHTSAVEDVTFLPGDRHVLSCAGSGDPTVRLWEVESGAEIWRSKPQDAGLLQVLMTPDGSHFVTTCKDGSVRLWSLARFQAKGPNEDEKGEGEGDHTLTGRWVDMNGGEIEIRQTGKNVNATGLTERVTRHWTKGIGELNGTSITMTHFKGESRNAIKAGRVSADGSRIDWGKSNYWKRK